jgi:hypothetical protein
MKFTRNYLALGLAAAMALAPIAAEAKYVHKVKVPPTSHSTRTPGWASYVGFAGGCSVLWLLLASTKKGGPTPLEAQMIVGNCFLPFIGGYLVEQAYKKNNNIQ